MKFNKTLSSTIAATVLMLSTIASTQAAELVKAEPINTAEIIKAAQVSIAQSINLTEFDFKATQASISAMLAARANKSNRNKKSIAQVSLLAE